YDYMRLLWARVGRTHCRVCDRELKPDTVQSVSDVVLALPAGTRFQVAFPLKLSDAVTHQVVVENLRAQGFVRVQADGKTLHLEDLKSGATDLTRAKELLVIVDRLTASDSARGRIADAVASAFREGDGDCFAVLEPRTESREPNTLRFTERFECPNDGTRAPS